MTFLKSSIGCLIFNAVISFNIIAQTNSIDYNPLIERYRKIFSSEMRKHKVAGMSIALVYGDSVIWTESFGYRDKTNKIKAVDSDQYLIGSITKTFTGIGVMQLQQKGELSINDPLKKYLPEFNLRILSGNINDITIRDIMTHHSGIPGDELVDLFSNDPNEFPKLLEYINSDYAMSPPNVSFSYSNAAISLLGLMIEEVTGTKYTEYIKNNFFAPLNMNSTGFYTTSDIPEGVKYSYDYNGHSVEEQPMSNIPAGAIYSNVYDMAKYLKTIINYGKFENKEIIDSISLCEMFKVQNIDVPLDLGRPIGLTWFIAHNDSGNYVYHEGASLHQRSFLAVAPESRFGIVLLTNSDNGGNFQWRVTEMMAEAAKLTGYKVPKISGSDTKSSHYYTLLNKAEFSKVKLLPTDLTKFTGLYTSPFMCINIVQKGDKLFFNLAGHKIFLTPISGNNFWSTIKILGIPVTNKNQIFYLDTIDNRKLLIVRNIWGGSEIIGEKQIPSSISEVWKKRTGNYKIINVDKDNIPTLSTMFELKIDYGILTFNTTIYQGAPQKVQIPLEIISNDLAQIHGPGRYGGSKIQIIKDEDGSENLLLMGLELKKQ